MFQRRRGTRSLPGLSATSPSRTPAELPFNRELRPDEHDSDQHADGEVRPCVAGHANPGRGDKYAHVRDDVIP